MKEKEALVLFSGGLDSFLTAIKLIQSGYYVSLISFNNGSIDGVERVFHGAKRLIDYYGENNIRHVGVYRVCAYKHRLLDGLKYSKPIDLISKYPSMPYYQIECLACHTAMYISAIAYCKSHNIKTLAEGARISQGFIVEIPEMVSIYKEICSEHGISLELPVLNIASDEDRALELVENNFVPRVFEPQCNLGIPLKKLMGKDEIADTIKYFNDAMRPVVSQGINRMEQVLTWVKPSIPYNQDIKII